MSVICMWQQYLALIKDVAYRPQQSMLCLFVAADKTIKQMKIQECYITAKLSSGRAAARNIARHVQHGKHHFLGVSYPLASFIYRLLQTKPPMPVLTLSLLY